MQRARDLQRGMDILEKCILFLVSLVLHVASARGLIQRPPYLVLYTYVMHPRPHEIAPLLRASLSGRELPWSTRKTARKMSRTSRRRACPSHPPSAWRRSSESRASGPWESSSPTYREFRRYRNASLDFLSLCSPRALLDGAINIPKPRWLFPVPGRGSLGAGRRLGCVCCVAVVPLLSRRQTNRRKLRSA